ncbi:MAG TPA: endolytic transglycosylase MltG [Candidatus Paceibacterota bacterium]
MLDKLLSYLQRFFDTKSEVEEELSERWRPHANRRTVAILVSSGIAAGLIYVFMLMPPADFPLRTLVVVPEGATSSEIGGALKEQRVIRSGLVFRGLSIVLGYERDLHAGDYMFDEPVSVFHIVRKLALGAYGLEPIHIRIPEGAMTRNMATIFAKQLVRFNAENFLAQAKPMEGYLFPDTYYFMPNATEDTILRTMRQNFDSHIAPLLQEIEASGHTLEDTIVLASMLEREARKSDDRRKIAGVLWNRIKRGMPLQVDAVFLYSLGRTTFDLTMADLTDEDDPYNTYVHKGLPPSPIGSPSLDSIRAAIDPIESDNLFYLADRSGTTYYSKTYQEHLRKKRLYLGS